jgi:hypothetical protein
VCCHRYSQDLRATPSEQIAAALEVTPRITPITGTDEF